MYAYICNIFYMLYKLLGGSAPLITVIKSVSFITYVVRLQHCILYNMQAERVLERDNDRDTVEMKCSSNIRASQKYDTSLPLSCRRNNLRQFASKLHERYVIRLEIPRGMLQLKRF